MLILHIANFFRFHTFVRLCLEYLIMLNSVKIENFNCKITGIMNKQLLLCCTCDATDKYTKQKKELLFFFVYYMEFKQCALQFFLLLFVIGNADVSLFAMLNSIASEYGFVSADSTLFVCFSFVQFASSKLPGIKDNTGFECSIITVHGTNYREL